MEATLHVQRRRFRISPLVAFRLVVALPFLAAGLAKLTGAAPMVGLFDQIGLGPGFRYLTGALEVGGAVLLMTRGWPLGAALLSGVASGAVITHLAVIGGNPIPAIVLLIASAVLLTMGIRQRLAARRRRFA